MMLCEPRAQSLPLKRPMLQLKGCITTQARDVQSTEETSPRQNMVTLVTRTTGTGERAPLSLSVCHPPPKGVQTFSTISQKCHSSCRMGVQAVNSRFLQPAACPLSALPLAPPSSAHACSHRTGHAHGGLKTSHNFFSETDH